MHSSTIPEINYFNFPNQHPPQSQVQVSKLHSNNPEVTHMSSTKIQQSSQNKQSFFHFQQPSFLKSFEEYLSGHFKLIETHFTEIHNKFTKFDMESSQMKNQIEFLQKQLQSLKNKPDPIPMQVKSTNDMPLKIVQRMEQKEKPLLQEVLTNKTEKKVDETQNDTKITNQKDEKKQSVQNDSKILFKISEIQKRLDQLQKVSKNPVQSYHFETANEKVPALLKEAQEIPQVSSEPINQNIHQESTHPQTISIKETFASEISKNLYEVLNKKIYQLQNSFGNLQQKMHEEIQKKNKPIEAFAYEVQSLKNQLQEFKFKRQAKYLKMMSKESSASVDFTTYNQAKKSPSQQEVNTQNSIQEYLTYLSEKVQFLMATNKEFLPKQVYDFEIEHIHEVLNAIRKRLGDKVNYQDLTKVHSIEDISNLKKPEFFVKDDVIVEKRDPNAKKSSDATEPKGEIKKTEQQKKKENDPQPQKEQIDALQLDQIEKEAQSAQKSPESSINSSLLSQIQAKLASHEEFLKNMNKFYNEKLNQIEINLEKINLENQERNKTQEILPPRSLSSSILQSPQLQSPALEQIDQDPAFYNMKNHLNHKDDLSQLSQPQLIHSLNQQKRVQPLEPQQMYNFEFTNIRKKISKLNGKYDQVENSFKNFREEIMKNIEIVHKNDENKTDWESFKKAVKYFDEKIKDLEKMITKFIQFQNEENQGSQGLESSPSQIAAKKKWSCLLCDKQFKNYEGRTSQVRYIGVASGLMKHESPRAVSYMKQSQREKEYEKIYMKSPINIDTTNKEPGIRKRSLSKSKEYMKHLNEKISLFDQEDN